MYTHTCTNVVASQSHETRGRHESVPPRPALHLRLPGCTTPPATEMFIGSQVEMPVEATLVRLQSILRLKSGEVQSANSSTKLPARANIARAVVETAATRPAGPGRDRGGTKIGRGDAEVGSPRRARLSRFEFFEPILLLKLDRRLIGHLAATAARQRASRGHAARPSSPSNEKLLTRKLDILNVNTSN